MIIPMDKILIKNATIINEGNNFIGSVLIKNGRIVDIFTEAPPGSINSYSLVIDASGKILMPGIIDDHVHFRDPGLTYKADIYSESKAAVAGGVTSYMEMPNTIPNVTTKKHLEDKFKIASEKSLANYSFYIGATNDNLREVLSLDPKNVCGIKIFLGSSTGNMLINSRDSLKDLFSNANMLVAAHCEDDEIIQYNLNKAKGKFGNNIPAEYHSIIRNEEACYRSSSMAVDLAGKYNTRLHILHLSTAKELELLEKNPYPERKRITSEACVHHLWFDEEDYKKYGTRIKWNPAVKSVNNKDALLRGLLDDTIDLIATDHAPHTMEEKDNTYLESPSGGPMVQHALVAILEFYHQGKISLEKIVDKMCHSPAKIFNIDKRGFIRKGYWADIVILDLNTKWTVNKDNILYKCAWSPFEGINFNSAVSYTFVNGIPVYNNGKFDESIKGKKLLFNR